VIACDPLIDPVCIVSAIAGHAAGAVTGGVLGGLASQIQSGIAWVVSGSIDWWTKAPTPDLAAQPAVGSLQRWLLPVTTAIAVLAMISAAGKMAVSRKANPLIDVGSGLVIIAATAAIGVLLPAMLLKAGDAWSSWVLTISAGAQFGARLTTVLTMPGAAPGGVIVLGTIAIVMTAIQAVLMLFRQAAVVILAGLLPLAAAGTMAPATRGWFRKITGWMLALIFYKPAAAAVYATAFTMIGRGSDPRTTLTGFAVVLLSLLALPVLMKFFTWTTGAVDSAAGGGGFLGTMMSGAVAVGAVRGSAGGSGGSSAVDQARLVSVQLGEHSGSARRDSAPAGMWPGAATSSGGPGAGPGTGTGSPGAAAGAATGASGTAGAGAAARGAASGGAAVAAGGPAGAAAGAGGSVAAGGAAAAAGAAGGPVGIAAAAVADGAVRASRKAAAAMRPEGGEEQ